MRKFLSLLMLFILCFTQVSWGQGKIVDTSITYTYEQMQEDLYELKEKYPGIVKLSVIGKSEYGRDIYEVKLGTGKAILHINASHHAREWISTTLTMKMVEDLAKGYYSNEKWDKYSIKDTLDKTTISFVPMVNPDGVTLQQSGLKAFPESDHSKLIEMNGRSSDFKKWKANAKGIDLNRQYNANWYTRSTPDKPSYSGYKGSKPEEAKEVVSLLNLVKKDNPEMVVSYHTSGEIIYWKFGQDSATEKRDYVYAQNLSSLTGYKLVNSGYGMEGGKGFKDWYVEKMKKPGFTIELSPYVGETHVPLENFNKIWNENKYVPLYLAEESHKLYFSRAGNTGWIKEADGSWTYIDPQSKIKTKGWKQISGKWYYFNNSGVMKKGWLLDNNKWYYLEQSGVMKKGWLLDNNKWYYLEQSGAMKKGWLLDNNKWYYLESSGAMKKGWLLDNNKWYYLESSGAMKKGWLLDNNKWYYLESSGAMKTGWQHLGDAWYYFNKDGDMVVDTIIDGYKINSNGVRSKNPESKEDEVKDTEADNINTEELQNSNSLLMD